MISGDGLFEVELAEGGVPGVFLPTVTIVKGRLSPAALTYFEGFRRNASVAQAEQALLDAVTLRWTKVGRRGGDIIVKTNDFGR